MEKNSYLLRESAVSAVINALISTAFFFAFFSGIDPIPVWGPQGYAFDFVPQSFAVSLMSALVPGLLARKKLKGNTLGGRGAPTVQRVLATALAWAVTGLVIGAGLTAIVLKLSGITALGSNPALAIKIVYGAALGAVVTYCFLGRLVRSAKR